MDMQPDPDIYDEKQHLKNIIKGLQQDVKDVEAVLHDLMEEKGIDKLIKAAVDKAIFDTRTECMEVAIKIADAQGNYNYANVGYQVYHHIRLLGLVPTKYISTFKPLGLNDA